jgi:hypothetical protein
MMHAAMFDPSEHHAALQRIGEALGLPAGADLHAMCLPAIEGLKASAARYDWLAAGGIYRIGFDSVGSVSLDRWQAVIDERIVRDSARVEGSNQQK